eukprot:gene6828-394_t
MGPVLSFFMLCLLLCFSIADSALTFPTDDRNTNNLSWISTSTIDLTMRDVDNRVRLFHGVNHVTKKFPWYPAALLNSTYVKSMAAVGVNVVRLGFMWTGAQPREQEFNITYFETIAKIIDNLAEKGIYTLLDVHQDALSSKFCSYDGIPLWVANRSIPRHSFPWPFNGSCSSRPWSMNELTEACSQAYDDFYHNFHGMRDAFVQFWSMTSRYFKNKSSVIGYEIINEPFAGDVYAKPQLFLPGVAGRENLMPFYDHVVPEIFQQDNRHLVFFEPVTWGMVFNGSVFGSGFDHVPGGETYRNRSVFSFHYYCWLYDIPGNPSTFQRDVCDHLLGTQVFDAVRKDVNHLRTVPFLTEFAASTCDPNTGNRTECLAVLDLCDEHMVSWIQWPTGVEMVRDSYNWQIYAEMGLSRPYPEAVAGSIQSISFDDRTHHFHLCVQFTELSVQADTLVRVDTKFMYSQGISVNVSGGLSVKEVTNIYVILFSNLSQGSGCVDIHQPK